MLFLPDCPPNFLSLCPSPLLMVIFLSSTSVTCNLLVLLVPPFFHYTLLLPCPLSPHLILSKNLTYPGESQALKQAKGSEVSHYSVNIRILLRGCLCCIEVHTLHSLLASETVYIAVNFSFSFSSSSNRVLCRICLTLFYHCGCMGNTVCEWRLKVDVL